MELDDCLSCFEISVFMFENKANEDSMMLWVGPARFGPQAVAMAVVVF